MKKIRIWQTIREAFNLYLKNFKLLVLIGLTGSILPVVSQFIPEGNTALNALDIIITILGFFVSFWVQVALIKSIAAMIKKQSPEYADSFSQSAGKIWPYILNTVILSLLTLLGFLALVLPGFYLSVIYGFVAMAVVIEDEKKISPFKMSAALVKGNFWQVFLFGLSLGLLCLPVLAFLLLCGYLLHIDIRSLAYNPVLGAGGGVFQGLIIPFFAAANLVLYFKLKKLKSRSSVLKNKKNLKPVLNGFVAILVLGTVLFFSGLAVYKLVLRIYVNKYTEAVKKNPCADDQKDAFNSLPVSVIVDKLAVKKSQFIKTDSAFIVSDIERFRLNNRDTIGAVWPEGAVFTDINGKIIRNIVFNSRAGGHVDIVDMTNDGKPEFLNRGSWSEDAALLDETGKETWRYTGKDGVDDSEAGDMDGDGKKEIVVGFNGSGGVRLYNPDKGEIWKKSGGNIWSVAISDINNDGKNEIIHTASGGSIFIRDKDGNILKESKPEHYLAHFRMSDWFDSKGRIFLMAGDKGKLRVYNTEGKDLAGFNITEISDPYFSTGAVVKSSNAYYAAAFSRVMPDNSMIYIFDRKGNVMYSEKIKGKCFSIMPFKKGFLAGCRGEVAYYELGDVTEK